MQDPAEPYTPKGFGRLGFGVSYTPMAEESRTLNLKPSSTGDYKCSDTSELCLTKLALKASSS